jgi:hypothetical protein
MVSFALAWSASSLLFVFWHGQVYNLLTLITSLHNDICPSLYPRFYSLLCLVDIVALVVRSSVTLVEICFGWSEILFGMVK